jgi:hypothetical protein
MTSPASRLTTPQAQAILAPFNCLTPKSFDSPQEKQAVQQAVLYLAQITDNQILGILASSIAEAIATLQSYTQALGYSLPQTTLEDAEGAVYLKFNPRTNLCHSSPYPEQYRGVLIAFQSDHLDGVNELYGHLPLDLFKP